MFYWSVIFFLVAIVAGILGFGGVAAVSVDFARITFFIAIVLFIISLVGGSRRRNMH